MVMQWQVKVVYSRAHQTLNLDALGFKGIVIHQPRDIKQLVENAEQLVEENGALQQQVTRFGGGD